MDGFLATPGNVKRLLPPRQSRGKLEYQQHIPRVGVAVVVLRAYTNRIADIAPLVPALLQVLPSLRVGTVTHVGV